MATYYIIAAGAPVGTIDSGNVNGYPQVNAGVIAAQPGDVFFVDNGVNANTIIQLANGQTGSITVNVTQNITGVPATNGLITSFYPGIDATVNISPGIDADPMQYNAAAAKNLIVNVGDG